MKKFIYPILFICAGAFLAFSCATQKKVSKLEKGGVGAKIAIAKESAADMPTISVENAKRDTIQVKDLNGNDVILMKAVRDDATGQMVATDVLDAAVVTARFRNVAERHGKVDIAFQVIVPQEMQDSKWQLRFYPDLFVLGDSTRCQPVIITGQAYRKAQLKGYQQYERFLRTIISDTTVFISMKQLEYFLKRNIPQVYAFKNDSSEVSDEQFESCFGVSEQRAIDHYTYKHAYNRNERRKSRKEQMFGKYVKAPIVTEGIRLDTVMVSSTGDFIYNYIQTINTRPKLRKAQIVLSGEIFDQDVKVYDVPRSDTLTFYISSVSAFALNTERYLDKVIERRVEANTECRIDFEVGKHSVKPEMGDNGYEIARIKANLASLLDNEVFDLDSILVSATASPEGPYDANRSLAQKRSESVSNYFQKYMKEYRDSLKRNEGMYISLDSDIASTRKRVPKIKFTPRCIPENWEDLDYYVARDTVMTDSEKEAYSNMVSISDEDARERKMHSEPWYKHVKADIYPKLRTVKFNFFLHRKGMVKDTVHTTVLDSNYMFGVRALKDMDYERAVSYLRPYEDFNTAIAYVGLDRNRSALEILSKLEPNAEVDYLMAILHSRLGDEKSAVERYVASCRKNRAYVHRGNLDPEIFSLIRKYSLNKIFEDTTD